MKMRNGVMLKPIYCFYLKLMDRSAFDISPPITSTFAPSDSRVTLADSRLTL